MSDTPLHSYNARGRRVPFDPATTGRQVAGCLVCRARPVVMVGVFLPRTEAMLAVVLRLRTQPLRRQSTPCLGYGLCADCATAPDVDDRVEAAFETLAAKVTTQ